LPLSWYPQSRYNGLMAGVSRIAFVRSKLSTCALLILTAARVNASGTDHGGASGSAPAKIVIENHQNPNEQGKVLTREEMQEEVLKTRDKMDPKKTGDSPEATQKSQAVLTAAAGAIGGMSDEQVKVLSPFFTSRTVNVTANQVSAEKTGFLAIPLPDDKRNVAISADQREVIDNQSKVDSKSAAAIAAAFVAVTMVPPPTNTPNSNLGVQSSGPQSQAFGSAQSGAMSAGGLSGGSSSSGSGDHFDGDAINLAKGAQNVLSLPTSSSGGDLSSSPLYNQAGSPEIQSALRDIAFGDMTGKNGSGGSSKLLKLATTEGFQDVLSNTLGSDAQRDFNLMTAGAAISDNPNLPASGVALAKAYIYNNLSSSKMIASSQVLGNLNAALPGGGLGKLSPETLRWIALSGDLAFADAASLPPEYASRQAQYREGFESLRAWLKLLEESNALPLLDELRVPANPDLAARGWDESKKKFASAHLKAKASLMANKKGGRDARSIVKQMNTLSQWADGLADFDVNSVSTWGRMSAGRYRFPVLWKRFDPLTLEQARFYYGRLIYHGSMPQFYSGSLKPISFLVGDAQKWSAKITKEQQLRRNELARTKPGRGAAPKKNVAFVKEN
jgi:hypothetical protein